MKTQFTRAERNMLVEAAQYYMSDATHPGNEFCGLPPNSNAKKALESAIVKLSKEGL